MKCLSVRQPWAWLIVHAGKDIENRTWKTSYRGKVLIHAAKGMTSDEYWDCQGFLLKIAQPCKGNMRKSIVLPGESQLERGGIVGMATICGCVDISSSPWFQGPFGFMLADAVELPFTKWKGALQMFEIPDEDIQSLFEYERNLKESNHA